MHVSPSALPCPVAPLSLVDQLQWLSRWPLAGLRSKQFTSALLSPEPNSSPSGTDGQFGAGSAKILDRGSI